MAEAVRAKRQIMLDAGNQPYSAPVGVTVFQWLLPIIPLGVGFDLDVWQIGVDNVGAASTLAIAGATMLLQFWMDAAGTQSAGIVALPIIGINLPASGIRFTSWSNAFVNLQFGPDIQSPGGFGRYWQVIFQMGVNNTGGAAVPLTFSGRVLYR